MREACGVGAAGYVVHEAAEWHPYRERWYFFPRKVSTEPFDEPTDEREKGNNLLIEADAGFAQIEVRPVGARTPERGPSSVPGHPDEFIYMKSVEIGDLTESWIGAADLAGNLLADEEKLDNFKCERLEFARRALAKHPRINDHRLAASPIRPESPSSTPATSTHPAAVRP